MAIYLVVIGKTATGYSAHVPDVPGCAAVGKSVEQVITNMKGAMELHFEGMAEDGDPIPQPRGLEAYRDAIKGLDLNTYFLGHVQIDISRFAVPITHS